ncbi:DUF6801 domain-containing protein [Streptomyces pyxinae]|uniref:DUF6801 domain-containing protein n=1 Tax=Streptomyces pyxinae TaxID=2970734 RepID=UPI00286831BE|nr:DUF6801 domain-containing protein [Streptomyces sp. LP05-1]
MSASSTRSRRTVSALALTSATGVVAAMVTLTVAGPASADPVTLRQDYTCAFPLINEDPIHVTIKADIPGSIGVGQPVPSFRIDSPTEVSARAAQGLGLVGAKTLEGAATADVTVNTPSGPLTGIKVENTFGKTNIPSPAAAFTVSAAGRSPSLTFDKAGDGDIQVNGIDLHGLVARDASGKPVQLVSGQDSFDAKCTLTSTDKVLARFKVTDGGSTTNPTGSTTNPTGSTTNPTGSTTNPTGSTTNPTGSTTNPTGSTTNPTGSTTNPTGSTTNPTGTTTNPTGSTTNPTGSTTGPGGPVHLSYGLTGNSAIKAPNGTVPLTGGIEADYDIDKGSYDADLTLNPTSGNFAILGFLPVTSKVAFEQVGKTTGTLNTAGDLTTKSRMYVKLPSVSVFGLPIGGGDTCKTTTPADIDLKSDGPFKPLEGGKLKGTYTLPALQGCGGLNDIISAFTAGPGNTIDLALAKKS